MDTSSRLPDSVHIGQVIPANFTILEELGAGGKARVYLARDEFLQEDVAIKVFHHYWLYDPTTAQERFVREARILARLSHPCLTRIRRFGCNNNNSPFIVTDYAPGVSLDKHLENHGPLSGESFKLLFIAIANALSYAASNNVLHRDVKPANIIINPMQMDRPTLIDFGLARIMEDSTPSITNPELVAGSPAYMSPEQCQGKMVDSRSDIYSLGITMFQAITGELPFCSDNEFSLMRKHLDECPIFASNIAVSKPVQEIILKCLAKDPADRYQSASEVVEALSTLDTSMVIPPQAGSVAFDWRCFAGPSVLVLSILIIFVAFPKPDFDLSPGNTVGAQKLSQRQIGNFQRSAKDLLHDADTAKEAKVDPQKLISLYKLVVRSARRTNCPVELIFAQSGIIESYRELGNFEEANRYINEGMTDLASCNSDNIAIPAFYRQASHVAMEREGLAAAENYCKKAIAAIRASSLSQEEKIVEEADAIGEVASFYHIAGNSTKAKELFKQSIQMSQNPHAYERAIQLLECAIDQKDLISINQALQLYEQFRRMFGGSSAGSHMLSTCAMKAARLKFYTVARKLGEYAVDDAQIETLANPQLCLALRVLAFASLESGDKSSAARYCRRALSINPKFLSAEDRADLKAVLTKAME